MTEGESCLFLSVVVALIFFVIGWHIIGALVIGMGIGNHFGLKTKKEAKE